MKSTPAESSQGLSRVEGFTVMIVSKSGVDVHQDLARDGDLPGLQPLSFNQASRFYSSRRESPHTLTTDETFRCMSFSKHASSIFHAETILLKSYRLRSRFVDSLIHP